MGSPTALTICAPLSQKAAALPSLDGTAVQPRRRRGALAGDLGGGGLYGADADDPRPTFVIAFPPPNVTGELHMGHALQLALADSLVRWRRMQGFNCLFQPGYDHAGISTQSVVEKELEKEGQRRHDLGREAFEARVWEWLRLYGRTIMTQFRRMGASMDYRRERFTMDDGYVRAVMRFFVHLWERGWLYRDHRIVNWCPFHLRRSPTSSSTTRRWTTSSSTSATRWPTARAA